MQCLCCFSAGEATTGILLGGVCRAGWEAGAGRVAPVQWEELGLLDLHGGK